MFAEKLLKSPIDIKFRSRGPCATGSKINRQNAQKAKGVPLASAVPTVFSAQPLRKGVTY